MTNQPSTIRIITHSGPFHADDIIGVANAYDWAVLLTDRAPEVIRTRDQKTLEAGLNDPDTILVDVGGQCEPTLKNFDHHFVGSPTRRDGDKYAAAGLVNEALRDNTILSEFCRRVDLADNGVHQEGWTLSTTIHKCNPINGTPEQFEERFNYLVSLVRDEVIEGILYAEYSIDFAAARVESDLQVIEWVEEYDRSLQESEERVKKAFLQEGAFVRLSQYEPALMELAHLAPERKFYTVFPSPSGEWMVQQIPEGPKSPKGRKPLPEDWAGKRAAELDAVTGIQDCVFCHPARFIGGHKTLDGALKMAELALSL